MQGVVALASPLHRGTNVYRSKAECLKVLRAVETVRPKWWSSRCTQFLQVVEQSPNAKSRGTHPVVVLEGLDGVGKTHIAKCLSERLRGTARCTPEPEWADVRNDFRCQDECIARAFYCAANYVAAKGIMSAAESSVVIVDRWWCSTCAMALANQCTVETLPVDGDPVYAWPEDLPLPDAGFYLSVDETVRIGRIRKRAPEDAEERRLSAQRSMRATAAEAYQRTHMLTPVGCLTYREAVNSILNALRQQGIQHHAALFTENELKEVRPF